MGVVVVGVLVGGRAWACARVRVHAFWVYMCVVVVTVVGWWGGTGPNAKAGCRLPGGSPAQSPASLPSCCHPGLPPPLPLSLQIDEDTAAAFLPQADTAEVLAAQDAFAVAPPVTAAQKKVFTSMTDMMGQSSEPVLVEFYATWCG